MLVCMALVVRKNYHSFIQKSSDATSIFSPPPKKFLIVQTSHPDTGSTLLTNLLMGLFDPIDSGYGLLRYHLARKMWVINDLSVDAFFRGAAGGNGPRVLKTHDLRLRRMAKELGSATGMGKDNILFVRSHRCDHDPQCEMPNMLCIPYEELLYATPEERQKVVRGVARTLAERFPLFDETYGSGKIDMNVEMGVRRLEDMDTAAARLSNPEKKSKNFFKMSIDEQYGIHANHKGQSKTWRKGTSAQTYCDSGAKYT